MFQRTLQTSGNGGVIMLTGESELFLYNSVFYKCKASEYGGAIYFNAKESVLKLVCATECSIPGSQYATFAYIAVQSTNRNQANYVSVAKCSQTSQYANYAFCLSRGIMSIHNTNSSKNNLYHISGLGVVSPSQLDTKYNTLSNNAAVHSVCIQLSSTSGTLSYTNFISNSSPTAYGVVFVLNNGQYTLSKCVLHSNLNTLLYVMTGSLYLQDCILHHSSTYLLGAVYTNNRNNSIGKIVEEKYIHFGSHNCINVNNYVHETMKLRPSKMGVIFALSLLFFMK